MKILKPLTHNATAERQRSAAGNARQGLYNTRRWKRLRGSVLQEEPLCRSCRASGKLVPATVVDHIAGHAGNWQARFFDRRNLQPLCAGCHAAKTAKEQPHYPGGAV